MSINFRPAVRQDTPLIVGIAGPTKSGKTYSAMRMADGLANGGTIAMINAEGKRGHQYAERFKYVAYDIDAPFSAARYTEALLAAKEIKPAVLIIDSGSHMHDGPGGILDQHESELDRMAGDDWKKRDRVNFAAWKKPKQDENEFIYTLLSMNCPVIICFRAKEKIKIVPGKDPIDLGWRPIASDRISFETIFTVMLPPFSKGVPDLSISEMREPFDDMVKRGQQIDENLGKTLAKWAHGVTSSASADQSGEAAKVPSSPATANSSGSADLITVDQALSIDDRLLSNNIDPERLLKKVGVDKISLIPADQFDRAMAWIDKAAS